MSNFEENEKMIFLSKEAEEKWENSEPVVQNRVIDLLTQNILETMQNINQENKEDNDKFGKAPL